MPVVQIINDEIIELPEKKTIVDATGIQHPWGIVAHWSDEDLAKIDVYRVARVEPPKGQTLKTGTAYSYQRNPKDGKITQVAEFVDLPSTTQPDQISPNGTNITAAIREIEQRKQEPHHATKSLTQIKQSAIDNINNLVHRELPPHQLFDQIKKEEAERFLADTAKTPNMKNYPFLRAALNTKIEGKTGTPIAKAWIKTYNDMMAKFAILEANRTKAITDINNATDATVVQEIIDTFRNDK